METELIEFKIPEWALCYISNGECESATKEELIRVDRFLIDNNIVGTSIKEDNNGDVHEPYFSANNDIGGLACNVYDCMCLCEVKPK